MAMSSSTCAMLCPPASATSMPESMMALFSSAGVLISSSHSSGNAGLNGNRLW